MLVSFIPCEIDNLCASLEHTWLKNCLLAQIESYHAVWAMAEEDKVPRILENIPRNIQRTRGLLTDIYEGFSPAQLVERVPLAILPTKVKNLIKDAVHSSFLDLGLIQPLVRELEIALDRFEAVAKKIRPGWNGGPQVRTQMIQELKTAAISLRKALLALPREVILP